MVLYKLILIYYVKGITMLSFQGGSCVRKSFKNWEFGFGIAQTSISGAKVPIEVQYVQQRKLLENI